MNIKSTLIAALSISLLFITQIAHADFRKALDAYQARDGATMLKEVKDAVDKMNDDGLMLFLMATNLDATTSDYDETTKQSKSTLRAILPYPKWDEMRELLLQATNNSTVDTQYFMTVKSQFSDFYKQKVNISPLHERYRSAIENYAQLGSYEAIADQNPYGKENWEIKFAEKGDAFYQLITGLKYHGYTGDFGCDIRDTQNANSVCSKKDEVKGDYWLKKAVKSYELSVHDNHAILYETMCGFYKKTKSEADVDTTSWCSLVNPSQVLKLPDWVQQAKQELTQPDAPMIKVYFKDSYPQYELEVYRDGRVMVVYGSTVPAYKDKLYVLKSPKNKIDSFVKELDKLKVSTWDTASQFYGFPTDCNGDMTEMQILINNKQEFKRHSLITCYGELLPKQYLPHFRLIQIAKLKSLVEKHFDVNRLRYKLGNSKVLLKNRLSRESQWNALSKMEIKK